MNKWVNKYLLIILILSLNMIGCAEQEKVVDIIPRIYYFDNSKNELINEPLDDTYLALTSHDDKVEYIVSKLKANKSNLIGALQATNEMPIKGVILDDKIVKVNFDEGYESLSPQDRIGMRASIVYSLTKLDFIEGVDFYINDNPLTTATGRIVGVVSQNNIKMNVLDPKPATTPYTLNLYFVNANGQLEKEERYIRVNESTSVEKLVIEELIKGPNSDQLSPVVPSDMKVKDASTNNSVCQVDLSFDIKSSFFTTTEDKERMIYAIVDSLIDSLTTSPQVKKIAFLIDGKSDIELSENIDLRDTFERSDAYFEK